jgi:hypothetical protein
VTPQQIVAVALRLFAIWMGIQALEYVVWFLVEVSGSRSPGYVVYTAFTAVLTLVIFLVLWFSPRTIAGKLLPSQQEQLQPSATADTWLAIGCTLIGLWTLTRTIPKLFEDLLIVSSNEGHDNALSFLLLYDAVQLGIAVWLVLGGKGVGKIFRWAQYAGIRKDL